MELSRRETTPRDRCSTRDLQGNRRVTIVDALRGVG